MASNVLKCFCEHEFQDKEYGYHKRLHTPVDKVNTWRCTICGREQVVGSGDDKKKKGGKSEKSD
jgi:hypothetical protein